MRYELSDYEWTAAQLWAYAHLPRLQQNGFSRRVRPPGGFSLVEASSTETRLRGWACRTRTQICRDKISL
jgi:hypothetical protein